MRRRRPASGETLRAARASKVGAWRKPLAKPIRVTFSGGASGAWQVERIATVRGDALPNVARLSVDESPRPAPTDAKWTLTGVTGNLRYTHGDEGAALRAVQPGLGRPEATCAALIPIRK